MTLPSPAFDYVRDLVRREAAIVLEPGKEYLVESRLLPLAREAGEPTVGDYVAKLQRSRDPRTTQRVVDALTTNETSWLRDNEPFQALTAEVLPDLIRARKGTGERSLQIWSAACSSGQEPYGIAMVSAELLKAAGFSCSILATDISEEILERARAGLYSQLEMNRGMPAAMLVRHFTRAGTQWQVGPELKRSVTFKRLNLAAPLPAMPRFDVVFLRNVLIYFDAATKRSILQRVRAVMRPDGYLFLGGAETTLGIDEGWERVKVGRTYAQRPKPTTRPTTTQATGSTTRPTGMTTATGSRDAR